MNKRLIALVALAGASTVAMANPAGYIVFTSKTNDAVMYYSQDSGSVSTLVSFADPDVRLAEILRAPTGDYYVSSGPFPVDTANNKSAIYRIDNVFAALPTVTTLSQDYPLANPTGIAWHGPSGGIAYTNNAQSEYNPVNPYRGVRVINATTAVDVGSYQQIANTDTTRPTLRTADDITKNPWGGANDYYVTGINGGDLTPGPDGEASTIWKMSFDGALVGTPSLLVNFADTASTGLANSLHFIRTATIKQSANEMFVVNAPVAVGATNGIYKIMLDANGDFAGVSLLFQDNVNAPRPDAIEYNPFTDKVVFSDETTGNIYQINPDGTGFETVATGVGARGFYFVPAPGSLALVGLAGLAASRRRRA
ncbi:MAG: PEP-CTERM sorting domain-containing protein [Phycisphaeraceae bacterium]|nr:PEP-CTERM sorting domain-containing protein [Phycisphaerae bacterium]MBX3392053.1 PEP-CTERM sorting domain-containing protein [Phycisphaeraceae bacterium]